MATFRRFLLRLVHFFQPHRAESELQKLTDKHVGDIDSALQGKEQEILEV